MATCYEFLHGGVNRNGYIVYYGHRLAISQFLQDIESFSGALVSLGLCKGDVVTLYLPTCPQALVAFYACSKLGMIANIIHPLVPVNLLAENLAKTRSKALLFYDATVKDERPLVALNQLLIRCSIADYVTVRKPVYKLYSRCSGKRVSEIATYVQLLKMGNLVPTKLAGKGEDLLCYMHSGGTSGQPKIVMLNNDAFNGVTDGMFKMYHPTVHQGDFNLATLPVFHAYGLCSAMHGPLSVGYNLILVPKFDTKAVKKYLNKYCVTVWSVVPAMLKKMLANNTFDSKGLASLDVIWCGGDVCDESLVERVDGILMKRGTHARLMRGYGLTEVCGVCIVNNYDYEQKGSCGRPMPGNYVEIWNDSNITLGEKELGEIVVSGNGVMSGYIEGEDCLVDKEGKTWVKTGDVGYLDDGYLHIVDRKKRSLKIAAVNVFPAQIEECVKKLDFISEACAVGVKVDGKQYVKVFVTLKQPTGYETVKREVTNICKQNLIQYAVPYFVEVIDEMPRTDFGKIDYKSLSGLYLNK
ncbi:MAG: acyl--CoA ligase [Clostridiales bacterium]|nr:acyl--CoA ligase [Clostridiales bacterium]